MEKKRGKGKPREDLTGRRYGRLLVIEGLGERIPSDKRLHVRCLCECGARKLVSKNHLKRGDVKSCGCLRSQTRSRAKARQIPTTESHGDIEALVRWLRKKEWAHAWEFARAGYGWLFDLPFDGDRGTIVRYESRKGWRLRRAITAA